MAIDYLLFLIHHASRRVEIAGITPHPNDARMMQIARNFTMDQWGFLEGCRYLILDRDTKFTDSFLTIIRSGQVKLLKFPARIPNLNANAERWVKSSEDECLSKLILIDQKSVNTPPAKASGVLPYPRLSVTQALNITKRQPVSVGEMITCGIARAMALTKGQLAEAMGVSRKNLL